MEKWLVRSFRGAMDLERGLNELTESALRENRDFELHSVRFWPDGDLLVIAQTWPALAHTPLSELGKIQSD